MELAHECKQRSRLLYWRRRHVLNNIDILQGVESGCYFEKGDSALENLVLGGGSWQLPVEGEYYATA